MGMMFLNICIFKDKKHYSNALAIVMLHLIGKRNKFGTAYPVI